MAWKKFPHPAKKFTYTGDALAKHWARLHRGDCEPWPENPDVQDAWRLFHAGDFAGAYERGLAAGPDGYNAAHKAAIIYAHYLETDVSTKQEILTTVAERSRELRKEQPENVNAWYLNALALGRYSQSISVTRALTEGIGNKIGHFLDQAIALEAQHADAHIARGAYQSEVIGTVGTLLAGLTYGIKKDAAIKNFATAEELNPDAAIAFIEHANGLVRIFGSARMADAEKLYRLAAACTPADAMERLDIETAKAEVEE